MWVSETNFHSISIKASLIKWAHRGCGAEAGETLLSLPAARPVRAYVEQDCLTLRVSLSPSVGQSTRKNVREQFFFMFNSTKFFSITSI